MLNNNFEQIKFERLKENLSILLNSETGRWLGGDNDIIEPIYNNILKHDSNAINESAYSELIKESGLFTRLYKRENAIPQLFVIHIGHKCNINCEYCYAKKDSKNINSETIEKIATFLSRVNAPIWIQLMGGEPLLYLDIIKELIAQINVSRPNFKTNYELQTNGLLLNYAKVITFVKENDIKFGISYDGPNELSLIRYGSKTEKLNTRIEANIVLLKSLKFDFGILTVVSSSNIHNLTDVLHWAINNSIKRISFNPLFSNNNEEVECIDEKTYTTALTLLFNEWIGSNLFEKIDILNFTVLTDNIIDSHRQFICRKHPCGAGTNQLAVDINGDIYPCDYLVGSSDMIIGNVEHDSIDTLKNLKNKQYSTFDTVFSECKNCTFLSVCGSCLFEMMHSKGLRKCSRKYCSGELSIIKEIYYTLLTNQDYVNYIQSK